MAGWLIFVLLLVGFAIGVLGTASVAWIQRRRQRRLDISYRERNARKAVGEMPDVEDLIKSAMKRQMDEEAPIEVPRSSVPGPLHTGSKSCVNMSIDGYSALLRSRAFSLSQAEEVRPVYDEPCEDVVGAAGANDTEGDLGLADVEAPEERVGRMDGVEGVEAVEPSESKEARGDECDRHEDEEDPETPWIPTHVNKSFADGTPVHVTKSNGKGGLDSCVLIPTSRLGPIPVTRKTPIGADVGPRGLDASASDIISNPDGRDRDARIRSSFDPPFEKMARVSIHRVFGLGKGEEEDQGSEGEVHGVDDADDADGVEEAPERRKVDILPREGSPVKSPLRNNPFASQLGEEEVDLIKAEIQAGC